MSDKEQIKIHGVDVLKCKYYQYQSLKDCEGHLSIAGYCQIGKILYDFSDDLEDCLDIERFCIDNPNCLFKQLARKTQECDTLKSQLDFEVQQKECLEQECEELKEKYEEVKEDRYNLNMEMYVLDHYRKALEEIEEIANVLITETNEYSKCCHKDVCGESDVSKHKKIEKIVPCPYGNVAYCQYEAVDNILTIIKELKGE